MPDGLEGKAGRGELIEDLGERGGTFIVAHGGMAKLCSDEVDEERERCGDASIRFKAGPDMCTGEVTGDGEIDVAVPCEVLVM